MLDLSHVAQEFADLINKHSLFTIISHIHPDADAIGTSLGIYIWLKEQGKRVEVVNATKDIPKYLDFLPHFKRIKHKMDYDDSLVIVCDSSSMDRLGIDLQRRIIVNIDHHPTNTKFGTLNIIDSNAASSSVIAFRLLETIGDISSGSATAFYAALVSDTRNFTTNNINKEVFEIAAELVDIGVDVPMVTSQMLHRRSLASLRALGLAIDSLRLYDDARIAVMSITRDDLQRSGAKGSDLDGIVDYAKSLVTVQIAVMIVERQGEIKVSLRSKGADVSLVALECGGGGHKVAAGCEIEGVGVDESIEMILGMIKKKGILS